MSAGRSIRFDREIEYSWLLLLQESLLRGDSLETTKRTLRETLRGSLSGLEAQEKTLSQLIGTWIRVSKRVESHRNDGIQLLRTVSESEALAIHWGMLIAGYPFFGCVAGHVGRLLKLQGDVCNRDVIYRTWENYGQRSTVTRATSRIINTLVTWDILKEIQKSKTFQPHVPRSIQNPHVGFWLLSSVLIMGDKNSGVVTELANHPSLFPFDFRFNLATLRSIRTPGWGIVGYGSGQDALVRD